DVIDRAREHDHAACDRVPGGHDRVHASKRVEAGELDARFAWQALHRRLDKPVLKILCEEDAIALDRTADGKAWLEAADPAEPFSKARKEVAWLDLPIVGAAPGTNLRHTRREPPVLGSERIREHLDGFDAGRRQLEIEISSRWIDQAGAAHLKRGLRGLSAFDTQSPILTANDTRQEWHQALKVVSF